MSWLERFKGLVKSGNVEVHRGGPRPSGGWRAAALAAVAGAAISMVVPGQAAAGTQTVDFQKIASQVILNSFDGPTSPSLLQRHIGEVKVNVAISHSTAERYTQILRKGTDYSRKVAAALTPSGLSSSVQADADSFGMADVTELLLDNGGAKLASMDGGTVTPTCYIMLPDAVAKDGSTWKSLSQDIARRSGVDVGKVDRAIAEASLGRSGVEIPGLSPDQSRQLSALLSHFLAAHEGGHCAYVSGAGIALLDGGQVNNPDVMLHTNEMIPDIIGAKVGAKAAQDLGAKPGDVARWIFLMGESRLRDPLSHNMIDEGGVEYLRAGDALIGLSAAIASGSVPERTSVAEAIAYEQQGGQLRPNIRISSPAYDAFVKDMATILTKQTPRDRMAALHHIEEGRATRFMKDPDSLYGNGALRMLESAAKDGISPPVATVVKHMAAAQFDGYERRLNEAFEAAKHAGKTVSVAPKKSQGLSL